MIVLRNGVNNVVVTLTEKSVLPTPTYVFLFVNDNTSQKFLCYKTDISAYPERFNQFSLNVLTGLAVPTWTIGQLKFDRDGFYHYYIYEIADPSGLNYQTLVDADLRDYVPNYFTTLVETGKMKYIVSQVADNSFIDVKEPGKDYQP